MNRPGHNNIRNGIVWVQTGQSTCTCTATLQVTEPRTHKTFELALKNNFRDDENRIRICSLIPKTFKSFELVPLGMVVSTVPFSVMTQGALAFFTVFFSSVLLSFDPSGEEKLQDVKYCLSRIPCFVGRKKVNCASMRVPFVFFFFLPLPLELLCHSIGHSRRSVFLVSFAPSNELPFTSVRSGSLVLPFVQSRVKLQLLKPQLTHGQARVQI